MVLSAVDSTGKLKWQVFGKTLVLSAWSAVDKT